MPNFPRYQSKGELTTQQASVQAPTDNTGATVADAGNQIGNTVQQTAVKWNEAMVSTRNTVADVNHEGDINATQQDANLDNDPEHEQMYMERIDKSYEKNSKGLDPMAAKKLGLKTQVAKIQLQNMYKKKWLVVDTLAVDKFADMRIANPTENSLQEIKALLAEKVASGHMDATTAYEKEQQANKDLGVNRISQDLYQAQTPEAVEEVTQKITSGHYEKGGVVIDPDKKKSLLDIADRAKTSTEKKQAAYAEEALVQNRMDTITSIASGKTPIENIDMKALAEDDPKLAETLTTVKDFMVNYNPQETPPKDFKAKSMKSLTPDQNKKMKSYAKSITDVFLQDNNKELSDFVLKEFNTKSDGLTSSSKLAAFANLAALKAKVNNQQTKPDAEAKSWYESIKAGVRFLQASNPYLAPQVIGDFIVKNYLSGSKTEKQVMQEAKSTLKDKIIDRHKSVAKLPFSPNKIVDGEASVEDLQAGVNEYSDGDTSGDFADASSD